MAESHFGQNETLARDTLATTLWLEHFGQNDTLVRVTFWPDTLASDTLARETLCLVSLAEVSFWPKYNSARKRV